MSQQPENSPSTDKTVRTPTDELPLLIPEGIRYNCQGCGRCCSGWSVGLTDADYGRVKDIDWGSLHPLLKDKELFIHREEEYKQGSTMYPHFTNPRPDGTCPFLIDNLCFIHGTLSEPEKPGTCQIFPYSYVETPTGVYMGVAYNSMAAVRNLGELLTEQREKLNGYWNITVDHLRKRARPAEVSASGVVTEAKNPFDEVNLTSTVVVPWNEYLFLDNHLCSFFNKAAEENQPFIETVIKGEEIILHAVKLAKEKKSLAELASFDPQAPLPADATASGTNQSIIAMVFYLYLVYPTVRSKYQELWQTKAKAGFSPTRIMKLAQQISEYAGTGISTIMFKRAPLPTIGTFNLNKALKYKIEPLTPEINTFFCRWLYLKIFSKTYFGPVAAGAPVLSGYNALVACFLCGMLFAKSEAARRGEHEIRIADLYEAYWRLDREFLTVDQILPQVSNGMWLAYSIPRVFRNLLESLAASMKPKA